MPKGDLTAKRLRELLTYDADADMFTRNFATPRRAAGTPIGDPARYVVLEGTNYSWRRLVKLYSAPDEALYPKTSKMGRSYAKKPEPEPPSKPKRQRLKESPKTIAARLRTLGVPEANIARHLSGLKNVGNKPRCPRTLEQQVAISRAFTRLNEVA